METTRTEFNSKTEVFLVLAFIGDQPSRYAGQTFKNVDEARKFWKENYSEKPFITKVEVTTEILQFWD